MQDRANGFTAIGFNAADKSNDGASAPRFKISMAQLRFKYRIFHHGVLKRDKNIYERHERSRGFVARHGRKETA
jgi:hypothetical protein